MGDIARKISGVSSLRSSLSTKTGSAKSRLKGWWDTYRSSDDKETKLVHRIKLTWPIILCIIGFVVDFLLIRTLQLDVVSYVIVDFSIALVLVVLAKNTENSIVKITSKLSIVITFLGLILLILLPDIAIRILSMNFSIILWSTILLLISKYSASEPLVNFSIVAPFLIPMIIYSLIPETGMFAPYMVIVLSFGFYSWSFGPFDGLKFSFVNVGLVLFYIFIWVPIISTNPLF